MNTAKQETIQISIEKLPGKGTERMQLLTTEVPFDEEMSEAMKLIPGISFQSEMPAESLCAENDPFIEAIAIAKDNLMNAIINHVNGVLEGISELAAGVFVTTRRVEALRKAWMRRADAYQKELGNYSIKSTSCVVYKKEEYYKNESVRRLTEIHLAVLKESIYFNAPSVVKAFKDYEKLLEEFIRIVRMSF